MKQTIIIGGGITGLAAAYRLQTLAPEIAVTLIEREARLGGKIVTEQVDGFVIEGAPDSVLSRKPRGVGLFEELGLAQEIQGRNPQYEKTFVEYGGALHRLPTGLTGMIPTNLEALTRSTLISPEGQARLAQEPDLPPAPPDGDESVASFVTRRLGAEVYEKLVEPLMSGIYAGDGEQLSLAATFPQLRQLELKHGSLLHGLQKSAVRSPQSAVRGRETSARLRRERSVERSVESSEGGGYPPFVSLRQGMGTLVERLVECLGRTHILLNRVVTRIEQPMDCTGYQVVLADGQRLAADALILCTPAFVTAGLLAELAPALAQLHAAIPYASSALVTLAYREADLPWPLDGYGYVVPRSADRDVLACTWTSSKWAGRAPAGYALLRVYLGRYGRCDVTEQSDEELYALAYNEVRRVMGLTATPTLQRIHRWPLGMPQYTLGHPERLTQIEAHLAHHPGLYLAGAAYRGVGIPDCIAAGEQAAARVAAYLK
jgi:oxygen-dependent protoporphyrinogen oxidase